MVNYLTSHHKLCVLLNDWVSPHGDELFPLEIHDPWKVQQLFLSEILKVLMNHPNPMAEGTADAL